MKRSAKKSLAMVLASVLMLSTVFNGIPASASTPAPTGEPEASVESSGVQADPTSEATMTPYDPPVITPYTEIDIDDSGGSDDAKTHIKDQGAEDELPLSVGEIQSIQSDDATFTICLDEDEAARLMSREKVEITEDTDEDEEEDGGILSGIGSFFGGILDFFFPTMEAKAASDKMKVSYDGYASFCGHRTAVKYISDSGNYHNHLVYCLNIGKNSTSGDVKSGSRVPTKILFCLVNGARKRGETCHTEKYSSGNALEDYFITSAAIHILNGEVGLSYYDNGSGTFKKIKEFVEDAKNLDKSEYNTSGRTTISITYDITPKKTEWEEISPGLYRSKQKFVREKSGNIEGVTYTISGAPSGLTTGEINKNASDISDEEDLKRFDICIAQTDKDKPSANFYVYANSEAMTKIQAQNSVIKITAKPTSEECIGRQWTPTVVSQQKITFLEKTVVKNLSRTVKVMANPVDQGAISIKKLSKTSGVPIEGAVYGLYEDAECEEEVCQMSVTDSAQGLYTSEVFDLTESKYYIKELEAPDGYELDEQVYEVGEEYFTVYEADGRTVRREGRVFTHQEIPEKCIVAVNKTDEATGEIVTGAQFAIFNDAACTVRTLVDEEQSATEVVPEFGYDDELQAYVSTPFAKTQETYYLKETVVPPGYVDPGRVWEVKPMYGEMVSVSVTNKPVRTSLKILKKGERLVGVSYDTIVDRLLSAVTGDERSVNFKYEELPLEGAVFNVVVDEDVYVGSAAGAGLAGVVSGTAVIGTVSGAGVSASQTENGTGTRQIATYSGIELRKGAVVTSVTTDKDGRAEVTGLPFGKYHLEEVKAPVGYTLSEEKPAFEFSLPDATTELVSRSVDVKDVRQHLKIEVEKTEAAVSGSAVSEVVSGGATGLWDEPPSGAASGGAVSGGAVGSASGSAVSGSGVTPTTMPTATPTSRPFYDVASGGATTVTTGSSITVIPSKSESTGMPVEGAVYGLFARTDIVDYQGKVLVSAGTLIDTATTNAEGIGVFDADVPGGYMYYVKEIQTAPGYLLDESEYEIDFRTPDPTLKNLKAKLEVTDVPITIVVSKTDITEANEISNAKLEILDKNDEVYAEWETDGTSHIIRGIPVGDYTLRETSSPYGYLIASEVPFTVTETADILKVHMVDERLPAYIEINKTDRETGDPVGGCVFEIRDPKGNVVDRLTTDADGYAKSGFMEIGSYKSNGEFEKPFTYKVVETEAPDGYIRNDATFDVTFKYEDEPKEALCARLNVTNQPKYKKLVQTGGDYRPLALGAAAGILVGLGWYCFRRRRKGMGPRKRRWRKK